jgi:translation initiation factor IF-1
MDRKEKGVILDTLPSLKFKVELESGGTIIAYLSGKMNRNFIRIIIGDKVEVFIPATGGVGRIVRRF